MASLVDTLNRQCANVPVSLIETHVRRMPESYFESNAPAEIARHLRLLAKLTPERPVDVEVRPLGAQSYDICVVGYDRTGVLAAITTALASDGLDTQELRLATYMAEDESAEDTGRFVDVARVMSSRRGLPVGEIAQDLRERLTIAFQHLAEGDLMRAQTAAADSGSTLSVRSRAMRTVSAPWVVKEGMSLGDFRLESRLATGGMSEVYLATQVSLDRKAAVKIVSSPVSTTPDPAIARFQKEATVLASFTSPHIVQVLASGTANAANGTILRWLAMEFLPNGDLATWGRRNGPLSPSIATRWLSQALHGLQYAHHRGILHRDMKPHNLLLTADMDVKISDFGLLKEAHQPAMDATMSGTVMGTPQYISPEQAMGEDVDERSDIYSLGVSFFQMVGGRLTFEERTTAAMLLRVTQHEVPPLLDVAPRVPRPLATIIDRMVALRPEDRYQDVRVAIEDLHSYIQRGLLSLSAEDDATPTSRVDPPSDQTQAFVPAPTATRLFGPLRWDVS